MNEPITKLLANKVRRFKPYPAYKHSGVEWLGEIPAHWTVKRLKHLAALNPEVLLEDTDPALDMVYVDIGGVDNLGRIVERETLTFASAPSRARRIVRNGDVIVSTVRTYLRAIAPIRDPEPSMVVSTGFAVVRPADDFTTDFAAYALRAPYFVERVVANSKGVSFPAINESEMATYELAAPAEPEQCAIAAFLDRETARIDALVVKKERVIELLQEKRSALITQAVTKGLDPNVPMKDSGVEWLGEIPAHWEMTRFKHLLQRAIQNGLFKKKELFGSGTLLINVFDVYRDDFLVNEENLERVEADEAEQRLYSVKPGDIFFVRSSLKLEGVGRAACAIAMREPAVFECHLVRAQPSTAFIDSQYLISFLNSLSVRQRLVSLANTVTMSTIPQAAIATLQVPIPPPAEQQSIRAHLAQKLGKIEELVREIQGAIDHLKELRSSLISAAVTGKIDVREETA